MLPIRYAVQLAVVSLCVLFFHGCENSNIQLTLGPLTPFAHIDYDDNAPTASQLTSFSAARLLINLAGLSLLLLVVPWWSPRIRSLLASKDLHLALLLVAIVFNSILFGSILYLDQLWVNVVFWPTSHWTELLRWLLGEPRDQPARSALVAAAARLHFALSWALVAVVLRAIRWAAQRYVFIQPDRWWQFNLRGLLLITLLLGTGLGMLLRWWR